jgi:hypothetical protein
VDAAAAAHEIADVQADARGGPRGAAIGDRLLELGDGMPVTRWRAWLREESRLPRPLMERYLHAAQACR